MIPNFETTSGNLPPGIHAATWDELEARFGGTPWRAHLLSGLRAALLSLQNAGCRRVYVDGSFVTAKQAPGDFDACWETFGVDPSKLDPVLLQFANHRFAQKTKFGGELFFAEAPADASQRPFRDFFQRDRTGRSKGIVAIDLGGIT